MPCEKTILYEDKLSFSNKIRTKSLQTFDTFEVCLILDVILKCDVIWMERQISIRNRNMDKFFCIVMDQWTESTPALCFAQTINTRRKPLYFLCVTIYCNKKESAKDRAHDVYCGGYCGISVDDACNDVFVNCFSLLRDIVGYKFYTYTRHLER